VTQRFEILKAFEKYGWTISDKRMIEIMKERGFTISLNDIKIIRDLNQPKERVTKEKVPLIPSSPIDWSSLGTPIIRKKPLIPRINKAAKIRGVFETYGVDTPDKNVKAILEKDGIDVNKNHIATTRYAARHPNRRKMTENDFKELESIRNQLLRIAEMIKQFTE
jgi:hypothetical protein